MRMGVLLLVAVLAGCGADGAPVRPTAEASLGLGAHGVTAGGSVGVRQGPVSVGVAF